MTRRLLSVGLLASMLLGMNSGCCRLCDRWRNNLCDRDSHTSRGSRARSDDRCEPRSMNDSGYLGSPSRYNDDCSCD